MYLCRYINDGVHPRILADGFDAARMEVLNAVRRVPLNIDYLQIATFLEEFKVKCGWEDSDILSCIASSVPRVSASISLVVLGTSLRTKLPGKQADQLADIIVQALQLVRGDKAYCYTDIVVSDSY